MNILFLCTSNVNRSKTAEDYYSAVATKNTYRSAGLSEKYCALNNTPLCSTDLLRWAHIIFVMEEEHSRRVRQHTGDCYLDKIVNLAIKDIYEYMDPALVELLINKIEDHVTSMDIIT